MSYWEVRGNHESIKATGEQVMLAAISAISDLQSEWESISDSGTIESKQQARLILSGISRAKSAISLKLARLEIEVSHD